MTKTKNCKQITYETEKIRTQKPQKQVNTITKLLWNAKSPKYPQLCLSLVSHQNTHKGRNKINKEENKVIQIHI